MKLLSALSVLEVSMVVPSGDLRSSQLDGSYVEVGNSVPLCASEIVVCIAPISYRLRMTGIKVATRLCNCRRPQ